MGTRGLIAVGKGKWRERQEVVKWWEGEEDGGRDEGKNGRME